MVTLINKATKKLDLWAVQYPVRILLVMLLIAVVVIVVANCVVAEGIQSVRGAA